MNRAIGSVFMTRLVSFRGENKKQGVNGKQEVLSIANEAIRDIIEEGDYVICRVEERTASLRDDQGEIIYDDNGQPKLSNEKFIRNEVVKCGTYEEVAEAFYADEIIEAQAGDFIKEQATKAKEARKMPKPAVVAPVVETVVDNAEPAMAKE